MLDVRTGLRAGLLLTASSAVLASAVPALAQTAANSQSDSASQLEEVVVTATRQAENVNRVPLSITAQTQRTLDQRGIRTIQDLQAQVPALRVTGSTGAGTATIAIRGIAQGSQGAATTGLYLDETPIQRRNTGATAAANGTPLPALFDLDRVEVLRGPQGTLFGGSSQGGTIRFIQPNPSLTTYSAYARAQISTVNHGDMSHEESLAVGGPIIQDKLGFRVAFSNVENGGYIDFVNPINGQRTLEDTNKEYRQSLRGALRWQVTDRLTAQGSVFLGRTSAKDSSSAYNLPIDQPITVPTVCYNTNRTPLGTAFNAAGENTSARAAGGLNTLPFTAAARTTPNPVARGDAACNAARARGDWTYQTPAYTLGPYALEPYERLAVDINNPRTQLMVSNLDLTYDFDKMTVKSITSYLHDQAQVNSFNDFQINRVQVGNAGNTGGSAVNAMFGNFIIPSGITFPVLPGIGANYHAPMRFTSDNDRWGMIQELRFSSAADARPFSWVTGVYYANVRSRTNTRLSGESNRYSLAQYGINEVQRYDVASFTSDGLPGIFAFQYQLTKDVDVAAFGEANYWVIPEKLRLTAGIRWTRTTFSYDYTEKGQSVSIGPDASDPARREPNFTNNGRSTGSVTESPITPKLAAQYQINRDSLFYVSAAKGFRPGGINTPVAQAAAGDQLARQFNGATVFDLPQTYKSDTVWSYEAGAKIRLFNRVQVNGSLYRIDWTDTQFLVSAGGGQSFVANVAGARSEGFEVEAEARPFRMLTLYGSTGYNRAKYTETFNATLRNGATIPAVLKDQAFAQPKWTYSAGARLDFDVSSRFRSYVRADWRHTGGFENAPFGTANWNPDSNVTPAVDIVNARLGVEYGDVDINLFVNNLFETRKANIGGGRSQCLLPAQGGTEACTTFQAYAPFRSLSPPRPREIGLQIAIRR